MIIKFDKKLAEKNPGIFEYAQNKYSQKLVAYVINSDYRKAVMLKPWIKDQVKAAKKEGQLKKTAKKIDTGNNHDFTMINILRWVRTHISYMFDHVLWHMAEYWQTGEETLTKKRGDCEDGAILMYLLARLKGIPADQLQLWCGDVEVPGRNALGGHCCLMYRPTEYPLNWNMIDWCYHYDKRGVARRNLYYINAKKVSGYAVTGNNITGKDKRYREMWFSFNEDISYVEFKRKSRK